MSRLFSARKFYKRPKTMLTVILLITLFFGLQIIRLKFDNNNFRFIPKNDAARISSKKISQTFGDNVPILIGVERQFSEILDKDFLNELKTLEKELRKIQLVKEVVLLTNTKHLDSNNEDIVADLLIPENFSGTENEINIIKNKLRSWPLYTRSLVSADLKSTQVLVFLNITNEESGSPEATKACKAIMKICDNWSFPDSTIYLTGTPVFNEIVNQATAHDLTFLVPLVILVVVVILFLSFGRFSGVFLPLATVITSVIWALGAMSIFNVPLSILSTILPIILIAVGSAYGIHVINHYYDEVTQNNTISKEEHTNQVITALSEVIKPVALAALTTFSGFFSFCFTSVVPIFEFGMFASFGVIAAFLISITLIPCILILRGPKAPMIRKAKNPDEKANKLDKIIALTFEIIAERSRTVLLLTVIITFVSLIGLNKLIIDNVLMEYFEEDVPVVQSDVFMRKNFGGSKVLDMLITVKDDSSIVNPELLKSLDDLTKYLEEEVDEVGKVTSVVPIVKRINQVYNANESAQGITPLAVSEQNDNSNDAEELDDFGDFGDFGEEENADEVLTNSSSEKNTKNKKNKQYTQEEVMDFLTTIAGERKGAHLSSEKLIRELGKKLNYKGLSYYEIPYNPTKYGKTSKEELTEVIENYLILLGKDAEAFVDNISKPRALKVNIQLRTIGQQDSDKALKIIEEFIALNFPKNVNIEYGGFVLIEKSLNKLVVESQLISVCVSLIIVFLILSIYYRSIVAGIIGVIPLGLSILINFGTMGFLGIKLNIGTAMVASFAIGIGVDYTIHFLAAYRSYWRKMKGDEKFLYQTFLGSGKAILFNAVSVGAGFAVLMLSKFNMLGELGFLIALIMITSSLGSLTVLPILLKLIKPKFIGKDLPSDDMEDII